MSCDPLLHPDLYLHLSLRHVPLAAGGWPPPAAPTLIPVAAHECNYCWNEAPEESLAPWCTVRGRIRDILTPVGLPPVPSPRIDRGTDMCLSYHLRLGCNTQCQRSSDHHPQTSAETARLVTWCQAHLHPLVA